MCIDNCVMLCVRVHNNKTWFIPKILLIRANGFTTANGTVIYSYNMLQQCVSGRR